MVAVIDKDDHKIKFDIFYQVDISEEENLLIFF